MLTSKRLLVGLVSIVCIWILQAPSSYAHLQQRMLISKVMSETYAQAVAKRWFKVLIPELEAAGITIPWTGLGADVLQESLALGQMASPYSILDMPHLQITYDYSPWSVDESPYAVFEEYGIFTRLYMEHVATGVIGESTTRQSVGLSDSVKTPLLPTLPPLLHEHFKIYLLGYDPVSGSIKGAVPRRDLFYSMRRHLDETLAAQNLMAQIFDQTTLRSLILERGYGGCIEDIMELLMVHHLVEATIGYIPEGLLAALKRFAVTGSVEQLLRDIEASNEIDAMSKINENGQGHNSLNHYTVLAAYAVALCAIDIVVGKHPELKKKHPKVTKVLHDMIHASEIVETVRDGLSEKIQEIHRIHKSHQESDRARGYNNYHFMRKF